VHDLEGEESILRTVSDLSFHTLREYVPGDDRRFIHGKSSARNGTLQVREFVRTHRSQIAIVLSGRGGDYLAGDGAGDPAEFEVAVGCAASMVAELIRQRRAVITDAAGLAIRAVTVDGVLDRFSAVHVADDAPDLIERTRLAVRRNPRVSLLVLVFGSAVEGAQLRAAIRTCPPGASVLAVRARLGQSPHPARQPGHSAHQVLTVDDVRALPGALRAGR
jgi:uncharacterized protein (DUF58 family)